MLDRQVLKSWGEGADRCQFWGPIPRCTPRPPPLLAVAPPGILPTGPALSAAPRAATLHPGAEPCLPRSLCVGAGSQLGESRGGAVIRSPGLWLPTPHVSPLGLPP